MKTTTLLVVLLSLLGSAVSVNVRHGISLQNELFVSAPAPAPAPAGPQPWDNYVPQNCDMEISDPPKQFVTAALVAGLTRDPSVSWEQCNYDCDLDTNCDEWSFQGGLCRHFTGFQNSVNLVAAVDGAMHGVCRQLSLSPTPSLSDSRSPTPSSSNSRSRTPAPSVSGSISETPSISRSRTPSVSSSETPSVSPTNSATPAASTSNSRSNTPVPSYAACGSARSFTSNVTVHGDLKSQSEVTGQLQCDQRCQVDSTCTFRTYHIATKVCSIYSQVTGLEFTDDSAVAVAYKGGVCHGLEYSSSPSATSSQTPSRSSSRSAVPSYSRAASSSASRSFSSTKSRTPLPSPTAFPSSTPSLTMTPTISLTRVPSSSRASSGSQTPVPSTTNTKSISLTRSATSSVSFTKSASATSSPEASSSPSTTNSASATPASSITRTATRSATASVSRTRDPSQTPTSTPGPSFPGHVAGQCETLEDQGEAIDVLVFENVDLKDSQVDGQLWVGGDALLKGSVTIGVELDDSAGSRDDLVVGGDLDYRGGVVPNGMIVANGAQDIRYSVEQSFGDLNGLGSGNSFDFSSAEERYKYQAYTYCQYTPGLTSNVVNSDIEISSNNFASLPDDFAIVELSCADLRRSKTLSFDTNLAGRTIVAQLRTSSANETTCKLEVTHTYNPRKLLFVTCGYIDQVKIQGEIKGSLLAPMSKIVGDHAKLDGQLVAANVGAIFDGEFQHTIFDGCLPSYIYTNMPSSWVPEFDLPW